MTKKLKTLEEFNSSRYSHWNHIIAEHNKPQPNGIACPNCGEELYDRDSSILTSNPPKKDVICLKCDYTGYEYLQAKGRYFYLLGSKTEKRQMLKYLQKYIKPYPKRMMEIGGGENVKTHLK